ncbi:MAG: EI24 domain-containing protein [Bacteroidota bacterium]
MITEFFAGIKSYFNAFHLISKLRLWKFVLVPGIISVFLGIALFTVVKLMATPFGHWLVSWYPFSWGQDALFNIAFWIGVVFIVALGLVIYKHLVMIVSAPFMSPLSERIEQHLAGVERPFSGFSLTRALKDLGRGLYISLRNLIREVLFIAPLLVLSLIPGLGFIPAILIFLIQAYYAGFGNMDYTLERHFNSSESIRFVKSHRWLAIGNGTVFMFLLMTGLGFLFAPPLAAVAATVETVKRIDVKELDNEYV